MFYIYGTKDGVIRGQHANLYTQFVLINLSGSSKVLVDNGKEKQTFVLDRPHIGIYLPQMYWKDMYDFSEDSVLLVLASELYDPKEYIKDYTLFTEMVEQNGL